MLAIIGAGPKALAIALKAQVLRNNGYNVPEIHIFEQHNIGANWQGQFGFTDGESLLGTPPEKDLGYPYAVEQFPAEIINEMQQYSWQSYLVHSNQFSQWIDKGKPQPTHRLWQHYLTWAASKLDENTQFHFQKVTRLSTVDSGWKIKTRQLNAFRANSLVITGPGCLNNPTAVDNKQQIFDAATYWRQHQSWKLADNIKLAVVGGGEMAASILLSLSQSQNKTIQLYCINKNGTPKLRQESSSDNAIYSNPQLWEQYQQSQRSNFIETTDLGVFSPAAAQALSQVNNLTFVKGKVNAKNIESYKKDYDIIIYATGFNKARMLTSLLDQASYSTLCRQLNLSEVNDELLSRRVSRELQLNGLNPKLFFPSLGAKNWGCGFSNLSCLGHLSDRILMGLAA